MKNVLKKMIPYKVALYRRSLILLWKKITKANMRRMEFIRILHLHLADHCNPDCRWHGVSFANRCIAVDNGRLYTCPVIPYAKYFNARFNKNLRLTEDYYIYIYKAKDIDQILSFISRPMPFCRYCNKKGIIWDIGYGRSKKDIRQCCG